MAKETETLNGQTFDVLVDKIKQMIPPDPRVFASLPTLHRAPNVRFAPLGEGR
jgi:hypothetical protein